MSKNHAKCRMEIGLKGTEVQSHILFVTCIMKGKINTLLKRNAPWPVIPDPSCNVSQIPPVNGKLWFKVEIWRWWRDYDHTVKWKLLVKVFVVVIQTDNVLRNVLFALLADFHLLIFLLKWLLWILKGIVDYLWAFCYQRSFTVRLINSFQWSTSDKWHNELMAQNSTRVVNVSVTIDEDTFHVRHLRSRWLIP